MKLLCLLYFQCFVLQKTFGIPVALLYEHNIPQAVRLPQENDVSSDEIQLKVPIVFYGTSFDSIFVNSNGVISFQTELPTFFNVEFPLDYPLIAPFYSNVDVRGTGSVSYFQTNNPQLLRRATENIRDYFSGLESFQATNLLIVTWFGVGYFDRKNDKINTYQTVVITDGKKSFVEFLYPKDGIQWIQGSGDESGLPDARAQAGFTSAEGKLFTLPGSGTEQVRNLDEWSNMNLPGQFLYRVDGEEITQPDLVDDLINPSDPKSCAEALTSCHVQAQCIDYDEGFCCKCKKDYYGNGRSCIKRDVPLRVNGKVNGRINGEKLENLDLQSYIVMVDGRAYTAISRIPESVGFDIQSLQIVGGVIGYVFAKPVREALNGYQITGGIFNHTATVKFLNTSQSVTIKHKYQGLDLFDQLKLEATIDGEIPGLPLDSKVVIDEYQEQYTQTAPGVIQMSSTRSFQYEDNGITVTQAFSIEQVFTFDYCKFKNDSIGTTWKLNVGKNFISYEGREQIIRFGLSNKIVPYGDFDPCEEGRSQCVPNSSCVVDNDSYRCVCNPGYHELFTSDNNLRICGDIDECQQGLHDCDYNAQCLNHIGSFSCQCNPGYTGSGQVCVNEFSCASVNCRENAECVELNQIARCQCVAGFTGDGQYCSPALDHSCHVANNCHQFGMCTFDKDTSQYYCVCQTGYEGDGYNCRQMQRNESDDGGSGEREIQRCLLGVCWCPEGFKIDKNSTYCVADTEEDSITTTVMPLDEVAELVCYNESLCYCPRGFRLTPEKTCTVNVDDASSTKGFSGFNISCDVLNNCDRNAECLTYDNSSYICECNPGFEGDGHSCVASSSTSCLEINNCDPRANCTYDEATAKSVCQCNPGFEGDGFTCRVKAICQSNDDCTNTEECLFTTTSQRLECVCRENHIRDSQNQCVMPSTCGGGICVDNAECLYDQEYQLYYCSCKSGFMGDGITECKPKPIGCNVDNKCGLHATCEYDQSTALYQCRCEAGFYGDGFVCYTEINCHVDPTMCDPRASCVSDANRRYICQCNQGFVGNGSICKAIPSHDGNFLLLNQGMATLKIPFNANKKNAGKPLQLKYYQTAVGLDIDCLDGRIYWSDISGRAIRSSTYNGSDKTDFIKSEIGSPEGLALDWLSRNIYWTDSTKDTIEVASIEGKRRRVLFDTNLVNPRGIAVHPQRGKIFWSDWDRKNPKIEWANADGSGREIFLQGEAVSLPNSLTIDYETENLCYADAGTKKIECVDIDSRVKRTVATNCTYPFGIATTRDQVYWSDWITKKIERADKASLTRLPALQVPLGGSGNKLYGLVAVPPNCPIHLTNVCQYSRNQCPVDHICLPNGTGSRTCVCTSKADSSEHPSCTL